MKSKVITAILLMACTVTFSLSVRADSQKLASCFTDSLNGKERKQLVKWIFLSMAAHPDLKPYSNISEEEVSNSDSVTGTLITRLFVEDCQSEAKEAQASDPLAIRQAFEYVGQVAMQELITNPNVMTAISNYINYTDQGKINAIFSE